jgi:hypothetical protein
MLVVFTRAAGGSTVVTLHRRDGVVVELPGYDRKFRVPHDLAHLVTERELGLADGVFGSIAGGGMFSNMRVVGGKPRHDAASRSKRLLDANKQGLGMAEVLAGAVHDDVEHGSGDAPVAARRVWTAFGTGPFPWTDRQITDAVHMLTELTEAWYRDGRLATNWPDRLVEAVPAATTGVHRGRHGRT